MREASASESQAKLWQDALRRLWGSPPSPGSINGSSSAAIERPPSARSALVSVTCLQWLGGEPWLTQSVAIAIAVMHLTRTLHPPGGATALIAVIGSDQGHTMGYRFAVLPATLGPALLVVALLVNDLSATRRYPELWS